MSLPAGSTIGILGGGQLGRMLASAAARLGFDVHVYAPEADAPAARVAAHHVRGAWEDAEALAGFAADCDAVTLEWENVPVGVVEALVAAGTPVHPCARALAMAQDRAAEKRFFEEIGLGVTPWRAVDEPSDLEAALAAFGSDLVLKTRREGYDGKGQARLGPGDDAAKAFAAIGAVPAIAEAVAPFELELSALVVRGQDGEMLAWDTPLNEHEGGILRRSVVPAPVPGEVVEAAQAQAMRLAEALGYVGVLALEFFLLPGGRLLANEFAPRVHNSGHWTPEACETGQFENHIRAVAGWPLRPVTRHHDAEMVNLIGEEGAQGADAYPPGSSLTLYGKRAARKGRKMGHLVRRTGPAFRR